MILFSPPLIVMKILQEIESSRMNVLHSNKHIRTAVMYSIGLFVAVVTKTLSENQYYDVTFSTGAYIRATLSAAVYNKALRLGQFGDGAERVRPKTVIFISSHLRCNSC
jgi:hypothetical protein